MSLPKNPETNHRFSLVGNPDRRSAIVLAILASVSIAMPSLIVATSVGRRPASPVMIAKPPVISPQDVPSVDPVKLVDLAPDDARTINAAVPFSAAPNPAARPFYIADSGIAAARAIDCLATAVLYEAGDDTTGQRAVAQVIINRVRHPAFPKTICGVVFQGAERRTGCQFTFTCDGALFRHRWSDAAWARARTVAGLALRGQVFAPVGHATHYHTDWVVPYWSASLDKVSAVGTHLFFRWTGWWGTPPAFNRRISIDEPNISQLAAYSSVHGGGAALSTFDGTNMPNQLFGTGTGPSSDPASFLVTIDGRANPDSFLQLAQLRCGTRNYCKFMAWTERYSKPDKLPLGSYQVATMGFSYLRDILNGFEKTLWNCKQFPRADRSQCMKVQTFVTDGSQPSAIAGSGSSGDDEDLVAALFAKTAGDDAKPNTMSSRTKASSKSPPRVSGTFREVAPATPAIPVPSSGASTAEKAKAPTP